MKKEITLGNLLAILVPTFVVILAWGNSVETRLIEYHTRIQNIEKTNAKVESKLDNIDKTMTQVLVELQNKKNRDQ